MPKDDRLQYDYPAILLQAFFITIDAMPANLEDSQMMYYFTNYPIAVVTTMMMP